MTDQAKVPAKTPGPAPDGAKTITITTADLDALIARRVEAALAARPGAAPPAAPVTQTLIVSGDEASLVRTREQARWRFVERVGWTNVPAGADSSTRRPG